MDNDAFDGEDFPDWPYLGPEGLTDDDPVLDEMIPVGFTLVKADGTQERIDESPTLDLELHQHAFAITQAEAMGPGAEVAWLNASIRALKELLRLNGIDAVEDGWFDDAIQAQMGRWTITKARKHG